MRRRPAAAGPPRRRPATAVERAPDRGSEREDIGVVYNRGDVVSAQQLPLTALCRGHWIASEESTCFEETCKWAGKVQRVVLEDGEAEAQVEVTGTQSEALLKHASAQSPAIIRAHLCKGDCDGKRVNADLVHLRSLRKLGEEAAKTWEVNLVTADENAPLRRVQEEWANRRRGGEEKVPSASSPSQTPKKKKKKKKEKKEEGEKRAPVKYGGKSVAKKPLKDLFKGTGLDPDPRTRKKVVRKVKKRLRKTKDSSSTSSKTSTSSSTDEEVEGIMEDRSKIQKISTLGPGVLASSAIQSMKQYVLQEGGSTWSMDETSLPPLMSQYARMHLAPKGSGGILREIVTLSHIGDLLLQGRVAEGVDCVAQRLKSLELVLGGQAWGMAQKVEITPTLDATISTRAEVQVAVKESKLDAQARGSASPWDKGRGKGKTKDKDKGKGEKEKEKQRRR